MNISSLERRLAKLEGASTDGNVEQPLFFIWYRDGEDPAKLKADAVAAGRCKEDDKACCVPWRRSEPTPPPRWSTVSRLPENVYAVLDEEIVRWLESPLGIRTLDEGKSMARNAADYDFSQFTDKQLTAMILACKANLVGFQF